MAERRDSPDPEPEQAEQLRPTAGRRFARLVASPSSRRVALPRLLTAIGLILLLGWLAILGGSRLVRGLEGWVASRPEYQLPFDQIELVPAPGPWVLGGKSRILEEVRSEATHGESLSLLDLNPSALQDDFKRCAWVSGVEKVDKGYRRLSVHLSYRKPVAVVVLPVTQTLSNVYLIDEEGVPLPPLDIDWAFKGPIFRVQGISDPLMEIRGVDPAGVPRIGVGWMRAGTADAALDPDPMILKAAKLAAFLQRHQQSDSSRRGLPKFVRIHLTGEPNEVFFLADSENNWVEWGRAPGDERPGDPSAEERWKTILHYIDRHGPLDARDPYFLRLKRSGAVKEKGRSRSKTGSAPG